MAARSMLFRNPAGHAGLWATLASLASALARFFETRITLASKEAKGAVAHLFGAIVCLMIALMLTLTGYVFLIVFAIVGLAHLIGVSWIWVTLVIALIHFAIALFCLVIARGQMKHPLFQETRMVLKEDSEWLKNLDQANHP
jgi:uncharacterized membrane protein YqjE